MEVNMLLIKFGNLQMMKIALNVKKFLIILSRLMVMQISMVCPVK